MDKEVLIHTENLQKIFRGSHREPVKALDGVTLDMFRGETLGLVGESGSGKTTLGRTILRLTEPSAGRIYYGGKEITQGNMLPYREKMQIIFQNPAGSLDPRMQVGQIIAEGLQRKGKGMTRQQIGEVVAGLLQRVGLAPQDAARYPSEFSGGQQQRIGIARALAVRPEFIVCDEPVSALDVSYQSQVINLLEDLQKQLGLTYLFISHDFSVVMHIADRIGVMYLGQLVEIGSKADIFTHPAHPYTRQLLAAIPIPDPERSRLRQHNPMVTDERIRYRPKNGCSFYPRCPFGSERCKISAPPPRQISPGHVCRCCHEE